MDLFFSLIEVAGQEKEFVRDRIVLDGKEVAIWNADHGSNGCTVLGDVKLDHVYSWINTLLLASNGDGGQTRRNGREEMIENARVWLKCVKREKW